MKKKYFLHALTVIFILTVINLLILACQTGKSTEVVEQTTSEESLESTEEGPISTENEILSDEEDVHKPTFNLVLVPVVPFFTYSDEISFDDIKAY